MKIFLSVLTFILFMSTSSFNEINKLCTDPDNPTTYEECITLANSYESLALMLGFSQSRAYEIGSNRYDTCIDQVDMHHAILQG